MIQGCPQNDHWLTKFNLQHSMDGLTWTDYKADGVVSKKSRLNILNITKRLRTSWLKPELWRRKTLVVILFFLICSFFQAQQTDPLLKFSCLVHLCRLSMSASSQWSGTLWQAFASTSWDAHQTVRKPLYRCPLPVFSNTICCDAVLWTMLNNINLWFNRCSHMRQ